MAIALPDYGYAERRFFRVDTGGIAEGSLGGPDDYINRPGLRLGVQYTLRPLNSRDEARLFEALLDQAVETREDVSYPYPLDIRSLAAGTPLVDGSSPPGAVVPIKGLTPGFAFRVGQPIAVVLADGSGSVHKVTEETLVGDLGTAVVPITPWTRTTFADGLTVEIERPRIRGRLTWDGSTQSAYGKRPFSFTITERK